MLVLKRKEGQWVEIIHKSGDRLRIRVYRIKEGYPSQLDVAFDDEERNFDIQRPERRSKLIDSDALIAQEVEEVVS
jgi:uncharacterized protein Veg